MKDFFVDNYLLIMIAVAFILFAIVGYVVDRTKKSAKASVQAESERLEVAEDMPEIEEINTEVISEPVIEEAPEEIVPELVGEAEVESETEPAVTTLEEVQIPEVEE